MNWKDHPIAIAVASALTTVTFCATLVFTAIIPTWLKSKDNELATQQAQILRLETEPAKLKTRNEKLTDQLRAVESENITLRRSLEKVDPDSFGADAVYPRGFRSVKIGDRIDIITKIYADRATVSDEEGWVNVIFKEERPFSTISFFYDGTSEVRKVTSILFQWSNIINPDVFPMLRQQFLDKCGQTTFREERKHGRNRAIWSNANGHKIDLKEGLLSIQPIS
jgi:hypothetical protein